MTGPSDEYKAKFNAVMKELESNVQKGITVVRDAAEQATKAMQLNLEEMKKIEAMLNKNLKQGYEHTADLKHGKKAEPKVTTTPKPGGPK